MAEDTVEICGDLITETPLAWLVQIDEDEVWLPKSQTEYDGKVTFEIPVWLAEEKGLV